MKQLLFWLAAITGQQTMAQTDTTTYSVLMAGNVKGFSKTWQLPDGTYRDWFQYNDRGRGDSMVTDYKTDGKELVTYLSATGVDYMKNAVAETFSFSNGIAQWKNSAENEQRKIKGPAFYIPLKTNAGNMVKAILDNGGSLNLLPAGKATAKIVFKNTYTVNGKPKTLALVTTEGLGFTPAYTWIDESTRAFFANVNDWMSVVLKGNEALVPQLLEIQKKQQARFYNELAVRLRQKPVKGICIKNVQLFDAEKATVIPNATVIVRNNIIADVITSGAPFVNDDLEVVDGKGKFLMPGLWDMHTHMSDETEGLFHMAAGVTNIRDMGNGPELLQRMKDIKEGKIIGPDEVIISAFIDGAGPFAAPTGALINNVEEGKKVIQEYAAKGYQQIKLYSSIKPEWVKPLVTEARKYKMKVCGHIPAFMTATQAIEAGYNEITHMNMLVLNFFGDTVDTRSPNRFKLPAQKAAFLDLEGYEMQNFLQLLKEKNIVVDPTLGVFEGLFTDREGRVAESNLLLVDRMPIQVQRYWRAGGGGLPVPDGMNDTYLKSFDTMLKILKMLHDRDITIVPGTDGFAGFMLHRELELYVRAGIPANEVLQIATLVPAKVAGKEKELGSIAKGKIANMVLVDGNPAVNIGDIRKTALVIKEGVIYDPAKIYAALAIKNYK
jgi:imidazolonepropionase-like amidohydrolase